MDQEEQRAVILDFERNKQLLGNISSQKQQVSMQLELVKSSLEELSKTKEKTVYKIVGNILFPKEVTEMEKELKEKQESLELRLKTIDKQEENTVKKLKGLQSKLEAEMKAEEAKASQASETKIEKKKK